MGVILSSVKDFVILYLLVALLMQLLGDSQVHKYIRFFAGLVFLLLIMSPVYRMITRTPLERELRIEQWMKQYAKQQDFDQILGEFSEKTAQTAIDVLMDCYNDTLGKEGYEIKQYDCKLNEEDQLTEVNLYIGKIGSKQRAFSDMTTQSLCAQECRALLVKNWNPEFELKVYGKDGT